MCSTDLKMPIAIVKNSGIKLKLYQYTIQNQVTPQWRSDKQTEDQLRVDKIPEWVKLQLETKSSWIIVQAIKVKMQLIHPA